MVAIFLHKLLRDEQPVINGDALFDFDLAPMLARHRARGAMATLVLRAVPADSPFGRVGIDSAGRLQRVAEIAAPEADGKTLRTLITEAARWLLAHDVTTGAIDQLATLGLADAMADHSTREWMRRRIALDYVRIKV